MTDSGESQTPPPAEQAYVDGVLILPTEPKDDEKAAPTGRHRKPEGKKRLGILRR